MALEYSIPYAPPSMNLQCDFKFTLNECCIILPSVARPGGDKTHFKKNSNLEEFFKRNIPHNISVGTKFRFFFVFLGEFLEVQEEEAWATRGVGRRAESHFSYS